MSKFSFDAAREHIRAGEYDKAREVLMPIKDHPTAQKWLAKLDEIDPPFPDELVKPYAAQPGQVPSGRMPAAEKFLEEWVKTMQAVTLVAGILLILVGAVAIGYDLFGNKFDIPGGLGQMPMNSFFPEFQWFFWGIGLFAIGCGSYAVWRANQPDKIQKQLMKMKPGTTKLSAVIFFGLAVFQVGLGTVGKQTNQTGLAVLWVILGLLNWWHAGNAMKYRSLQGDI